MSKCNLFENKIDIDNFAKDRSKNHKEFILENFKKTKRLILLLIGFIQLYLAFVVIYKKSTAFVTIATGDGINRGTLLANAKENLGKIRVHEDDAKDFLEFSKIDDFQDKTITQNIPAGMPIPLAYLSERAMEEHEVLEKGDLPLGPGMRLFSLRVNISGVFEFLKKGRQVDLLAYIDRNKFREPNLNNSITPYNNEFPSFDGSKESLGIPATQDLATQTLYKNLQIAAITRDTKDPSNFALVTFVVSKEQMKVLSFAEEKVLFRAIPKNTEFVSDKQAETESPMTTENFLQEPAIKEIFQTEKLPIIVNPAIESKKTTGVNSISQRGR